MYSFTNIFRAGLLLLGVALANIGYAADIVVVTAESTASGTQMNVPVTFGHVFKKGDVPSTAGLAARLSNGTTVALQVDKKASHSDGSLRHAVLTVEIPELKGRATEIVIISTDSPAGNSGAVTLNELLASGFDATVQLNVSGTTYTASAADMLANASPKQWLSGPLVSEWTVGAPVETNGGQAHPHLTAYFHVRAYAGVNRVRVDVVVENNWTFVSGPRALTYDATVSVGGSSVYQNNGLTHYHHTRWHKPFWWGQSSDVAITHDPEYLQVTQAVPNYQDGLSPSNSYLDSMINTVEPMGQGNLRTNFADTGASDQIAPLARWDAVYAVTGDKRAHAASLANGSAGGSYSIHYRDESTGYPVSIATYPNVSENGSPTGLPSTSGGNPLSHDQAHGASIGYLAYSISGDYFYLEEIQFWANWNMVWTNPGTRQGSKGIFGVQNRGQIWSLRTLAQAAYITPDSHPLKQYLSDRVDNNILDRQGKWSDPMTNVLGFIQDYDYPQVSPWQADWFSWVFGYMYELGFDQAKPMRDWLARWPAGRMGVASDEFCFQKAPTYRYDAGAGPTASSYYSSFRQMYEANYGSASCNANGDMGGRPDEPDSYYANMQPGLAISVDAGVATQEQWDRFTGTPTTPGYDNDPQWAIIPRGPGKASAPNIAISADPAEVAAGGQTTITWSTTNADSCSASDGWSGGKATSGSETAGPINQDTTFSLTCSGLGGSTTRSVTVRIGSGGGNPPPGGGGGGNSGGGGGLLFIPVALAIARRRRNPL